MSSSSAAFSGSVPANYEQYLGPFLFEPYAIDIAGRLPKGLHNVLEVACGTGRVTKHLVKALAPGGKLIATDLNPDMITIAKQKVSDSNIEWSVADAQQLPFGDNTFDAIVCQFGVMFFPDKPKAFAEAYRVLKPGGRFIFNTWNNTESNPAAAITDKILRDEFGDDAPAFIRSAPYSMYDTDAIKKLLEDASFKNTKTELVKINGSYSSPADVANGYLNGTPLFPFLADKGERRDAVHQKVIQQLTEQYGETSTDVPLEAFVCEGVK